jgi:biopolymer transport protein ExbB
MLTDALFAIALKGHDVVLYLLILLSLLSGGIMAERYFALGRIQSRSDKIKRRLREALRTGHLSELKTIASERDSIEASALQYGLRHIKANGPDKLSEVFNSFVIMTKPDLDRSLNFLASVGSNAPFIGLLGTVFGIMKAFKDMAVSQGNAQVVMVGIAEALVATAIGLMVAIPAVVAFNHFSKQVKNIIANVENVKELCLVYTSYKKKDNED